MDEFHFLRPLWLLLLFPLALAVWRRIRKPNSSNPWRELVDEHLLHHLQLAREVDGGRRPLLLAGIGGLLAILTLAGPAWEKVPPPQFRPATPPLVIVLDLSASMDAADLRPNRLDVAREHIRALLERLPPRQLGLVVFAAGAHRALPLTKDRHLVEQLLQRLDTGLMPVQGSNPAAGLYLAARLLDQAGEQQGDILLVADSADEQTVEAAEKLKQAGKKVSVLGVGTTAGVLNIDGKPRLVGLDEQTLYAVARSGNGVYQNATAGTAGIEQIQLALGEAAIAGDSGKTRTGEVWRERGPWLLLLLLPLALSGFRQGWLGLLLLPLILPSQPVEALDWTSLWFSQEQQAQSAQDEGDYARAALLFQDPLWRGIARYRQGDYDAAAINFNHLDSPRAHYNRGNALIRLGRLGEAMQAYDQALGSDPGYENARFNRRRLERFLRARAQSSLSPTPAKEIDPTAEDKHPKSEPLSTVEDLLEIDEEALQPREGTTQKRDHPAAGTLGGGAMILQDEQSDHTPEKGSVGQSGGGGRSPDEDVQGDARPATDEAMEQRPSQEPTDTGSADASLDPGVTPPVQSGQPDAGVTSPATVPGQAKGGNDNQPPTSQGERAGDKGMVAMTEESGPSANSAPLGRDAVEYQQALDQWLQRIPDDSGGLLKELFRREHQRGLDHSREGARW